MAARHPSNLRGPAFSDPHDHCPDHQMRGRGAAIRSTPGTFQPHVSRRSHTERSQLQRWGQIINRRGGHGQSADHGRSLEGVTHLMVLVIVIVLVLVIIPAAVTAITAALTITALIMNGRDRGAAMAVIMVMLMMALCSQTRGRCHQFGRTQTITPKPTTDTRQLCKPNRRKGDESHHHSGSSRHARSRMYVLETNATRFRMPQPSGFAEASQTRPAATSPAAAGAAPATSPRAMASA